MERGGRQLFKGEVSRQKAVEVSNVEEDKDILSVTRHGRTHLPNEKQVQRLTHWQDLTFQCGSQDGD